MSWHSPPDLGTRLTVIGAPVVPQAWSAPLHRVIRDRDRDMDRRGPPRMRGCSEREARAAAREAGLRDPEVVRVTPGRVVVEGFTRRGPDRITFANERGCPEI